MRFSVIIPFQRGREYLADCLESLKDQADGGFRNFETILVTDHVTEPVSDITDMYSQSLKLRIVELDVGTGVAAARNTGITEAEGDYLFFLDSDDYLRAGALAELDSLIDREGDKDLIYGKRIHTWYSKRGFEATYQDKGSDQENDDGSIPTYKEDRYNFISDFIERQYIGATGARLQEKHYDVIRSGAADSLLSARHGIRNVSVLAVAFRHSLIEDHGIRFPEQFRYYSDLSFVCEALQYSTSYACCRTSEYVKRKHNDPVNFPSLAQEKNDDRIYQMLGAYSYTVARLPEDSQIRARLDLKLINYYAGHFAKQLRRQPDRRWRGEWFDALRDCIMDIPESTVRMCAYKKRRLCHAIESGDPDDVYRRISLELGVKMLWKCLKSRAARIKEAYIHIFMKQPVMDNWIMFECFFGKNYGDNPKPVYEYLSRTYPGRFRMIWSMEHPSKADIPYEHRTVKRGGLRYAYYLARCKYFVFNTKQIGWWMKRDGQVFLETWHGTPLKRLAFDMGDNFSAAPGYKKSIYQMTRKWDHLIAPNRFSSDIFRSCFMYDANMLEYGYPRNDILHSPDRDAIAASIRQKLGIPLDKKTILYAPTWRDDEYYAAGKYKFTLKLELPKLKEALGDEYVILLRTHYYIADKVDVTGMEGFVYNLSSYSDIADIYLISDICITDYSSVFFDYANLKRPMLFYTYDIDKYRDMLRGFYFDMESTVPGPLLYTTEEVIDAVRNIDSVNARFADRYEAFYERFCGWEDGHAAENVAEEVILGRPHRTREQ